MKRILIYLLSLILFTAQAEEIIYSEPTEIEIELPTSEELLVSKAVDDPVVESMPFEIGEEPPDETELLIPEDAHADEHIIDLTDLGEQEDEPANEMLTEEPVYYTVTRYATRTSLTYIFTPVVTPNLQENTEEQNQTNTGTQENTP